MPMRRQKIPAQKVSNFDLDPPMDRGTIDGGSILAGRGRTQPPVREGMDRQI